MNLQKAIERLREKGKVPLGVIAFDMKRECLTLFLFPDVRDLAEANALLENIGVKVEEE